MLECTGMHGFGYIYGHIHSPTGPIFFKKYHPVVLLLRIINSYYEHDYDVERRSLPKALASGHSKILSAVLSIPSAPMSLRGRRLTMVLGPTRFHPWQP